MNKKWLPLLLVAVLGIALLLVKRCRPGPAPTPRVTDDQPARDPASSPDRNRGFDRRVSYIEYTQHARCRMDCRHITQAEIEQVMRSGTINYRKSDVKARPCPAYALEGITGDNQRLRVVFAQCDLKTRVVTCIDLGEEWECHCPGDDDKYKNKN